MEIKLSWKLWAILLSIFGILEVGPIGEKDEGRKNKALGILER